MKKSTYLKLILPFALFLCASPAPAFAGTHICNGTFRIITGTPAGGSSAHLLQFNGSCPAACDAGAGTQKRAYIDFEDKQLLAQALTYEAKSGLDFGIAFNDNQTTKGAAPHGLYSCRVISIWENPV